MTMIRFNGTAQHFILHLTLYLHQIVNVCLSLLNFDRSFFGLQCGLLSYIL